ncbi:MULTISPECIES: LrgB family protein [unclassified Variovorax]|uniref:LrgB family protein n=1 Tax=unclassified Variovorax TaxID=663243 RepID=UPI00257809DE|nr:MULTISPECIES: LrgB family protein [unclassified Variovorax]MDM0087842.1 LrgB family protein [Variovorax sp. J22G40]MDM0143901.1 LrgB family protein [Variovorax sp. J2P1-31]
MSATWPPDWSRLAASPLPWIGLTLAAYLLAQWLYRRSGGHPLLLPVFTAVTLVIGALWLSGTPYPVYAQGTQLLTLLVGPATVALAVPLFGHRARLQAIWRPLCIALAIGALTAIASAVGVAWALGGTRETLMSLAPKSATMPIAMPVAERFGGLPALAAVAVALTGIAGTVVSRPLLHLLRVHDPAARGFAIGLSAHAIGMARELQEHPGTGAFAALAMGLNGIATALLMPLAVVCFQCIGWL